MIQKLQDSRTILLGAVAIFAIGLTTSGYTLGDGLRRSKMAEHRTVTVRGVSERNVTADLATWPVDFSQQGTEFAPVQQSVDAQARSVRRSEEHTSELQSRVDLVCRLLLEKKKEKIIREE